MNTYSFLTTKSWRIDADGNNVRQAYKNAVTKFNEDEIKWNYGIFAFKERFGDLTKCYIKYDKDGLASLDSWRSLK